MESFFRCLIYTDKQIILVITAYFASYGLALAALSVIYANQFTCINQLTYKKNTLKSLMF